MEQTKAAPNRSPQIPNPANLPPHHQNPHAPASSAPPPRHPKKRKADNVDALHANYFKLRALVSDLRPHFIEVLRTPDLRNSKVALEIRTKLKLVTDICKQINVEQMKVKTASTELSKKPSEGQSLPGENKDAKKPVDKQKLVDKAEEKPGKSHLSDHVPEKSPDFPKPVDKQEEKHGKRHHHDRVREAGVNHEKDSSITGTYVVGGSNFGWNFVTWLGSNKAVYYGVTKESRRMLKEKRGTPAQAPNK